MNMQADNGQYSNWLERIVAAAALLILSPLLILLGVLVRIECTGPILFRQERVGRSGKPFQLLKFRSMRCDNQGLGITVARDKRITGCGGLLRKTKMDELPQLYNIAAGDMSFVGPRPEVPQFVQLDDPLWEQILRYRPGLTDPLTIHLRNEEALLATVSNPRETYEKWIQPYKLLKIAAYLEKRTALTDLALVFKTIYVTVVPSAAPIPTMEEIQDYVSHHRATGTGTLAVDPN